MKNNTVAVILAGGKSGRMGVAKGLLKYGKTFWILEQIKRISTTTISEVYIGLGHDYKLYFMAIEWLESATKSPYTFLGIKVSVVINKNPELGPFSTLQEVLKIIPSNKDILLNPIDVPLTSNRILQKIIDGSNLISIPNFNGKNGHPVKLKNEFWNQLVRLDPLEKTARLDLQIKNLNAAQIDYVKVDDEVILKNLNNSSDWKFFLTKE